MMILRGVMRVAFVLALACFSTAANGTGLEESIEEMSSDLSAQMSKQGVAKVAVVGFTDLNGYKSALGDFVSEELITSLVSAGGFDVVERRELDRVLSEQSSYADGIFDRTTTAELQKLLGIDAIITGSITNLGSRVKINARAIGVETAKAFGASSVSIRKDETVEQLLGQVAAPTDRSSGTQASGFRTQSSDTYFKNSFLHIVPKGISVTKSGYELRVATEFRNTTSKAIKIGFIKQGNLRTEIISDAGDSMPHKSVSGLATVGTADRVRSNPRYYTTIDAGSHANVIWVFQKPGYRDPIAGTEFSITGQLFQLENGEAKSFSVGISGLEL